MSDELTPIVLGPDLCKAAGIEHPAEPTPLGYILEAQAAMLEGLFGRKRVFTDMEWTDQ